MSNGNAFERLWKLQTMLNKMVLNGNRDPEVVCAVLQSIVNGQCCVVPVDYDLSHQQQIKETGCRVLEGAHHCIRKNPQEHLVPVTSGKRNVIVYLYHHHCWADYEQIGGGMDTQGLRPTSSPEFLALIKASPALQRKFRLVCRGTVWVDSDRDRMILHADEGHGGERNLCLVSTSGGLWCPDVRFPAVWKDQSSAA